MSDVVTYNKSFSGADIIASIDITNNNNIRKSFILGMLSTLTYSIHQDKKPVRCLNNINAKDYVYGPRTIAGSLIFTVLDKHIIKELFDMYNNYLMDELPPFDITISYANEYGAQARMAIYGIRIINEGQTMSVNDIYCENTYQYVAQDIEYMNSGQNSLSKYKNTNRKILFNSNNKEYIPISKKIALTNMSTNNTSNKNENNISVTLAVNTTKAIDQKSLGNAKFILNPAQKTGIITITNVSNNETLNINVGDYPYQSIYIPLACNTYNAIYKDISRGIISNNVDFSIEYIDTSVIKNTQAPLILKRTDNSLTVKILNKNHNTLNYSINNSNDIPYTSQHIDSNIYKINNLNSNTEYKIYSSNNSDKSDIVVINTLDNKNDLFNILIDIIKNNSTVLSYDINKYLNIINECEEIFYSNDYILSISDSLNIKEKELIKNLDIETNENTKEDIKTNINICNELMNIVLDISNNENYYLNKNSESFSDITQIIAKDCLKNIFSIDKNITTVGIYNIDNNISLLDEKNTNEQDEIKLNLNNGKYTLSSIDKYNNTLPLSEIYIMSDDEKKDYYNNVLPQIEQFNLDKEYKKQDIIGDQNFINSSDENKNRILIEQAKEPDFTLLNSPNILEVDEDKIVFDNNNRNFLNDTDIYYIVLTDINNISSNKIFYKKSFSKSTENIIFDSEHYGIKNNIIYCTWIEDKDNNQISKSITVKINDYLNNVDIHKIINNNDMKKELDLLSDKTNYDNQINIIKSSFFIDDTINKVDVYDYILEYIMKLTINNDIKMQYIYYMLQLRYKYIDNNFCNIPIKIKNNNIILPNLNKKYNCLLYMLSNNDIPILSKSIIIENEYIINMDDIDSTFIYIVLLDTNLQNVSGFSIINISTKDRLDYKINIQEVI